MKEEYLCILKALGDKTRLNIIETLNNKNNLEVCELGKILKIEQTRLSHALKCLKNCGLVKCETKGSYRLYSLNKKFIKNLFKVLDEHLKIHKEHILSCGVIKK